MEDAPYVGRDEVTKRLHAVLGEELQTTKELHDQLGEPHPSVEQVRMVLESRRSGVRFAEIRPLHQAPSAVRNNAGVFRSQNKPHFQRILLMVGTKVYRRHSPEQQSNGRVTAFFRANRPNHARRLSHQIPTLHVLAQKPFDEITLCG